MKKSSIIFPLLSLLSIFACSNSGDASQAVATASAGSAAENHLSLKINGELWEADHEVFGAFHPNGYNDAIIISGTKGPKDKYEQAFNINLYGVPGPGEYHITTGNPELSVGQIGNLSEAHFLYGNMFGFDLKVTVTKASKNPDVVEATFEGTMTGNAGDVITITEGKFAYQE